MNVPSGDAEIFYDIKGGGAPVVLLHPFPANHHFWDECSVHLETRYKLILPDLRAHGQSQPGDGAATMAKHAEDILRLCDHLGLGKVVLVGVSIGGYVLFEFWRQFRERVQALVLSDTRAAADTTEGRTARMKSIEDVKLRGPVPFVEAMLPKLLGESTMRNRLDRVETARAMMLRSSVPGIAAALQGLADRQDSTPTLKEINVPTLIIAGDEDTLTPLPDAQFMRHGIAGSQLEIIPHAGHYAAFEQPEHFARVLRSFLDGLRLSE